MIDRHERMRQLRAEDPGGRRSNTQLERQVEMESIHQRIADLPDCGQLYEVRAILSDLAAIVEGILP